MAVPTHEFICENCRKRVSPSAKVCPHCGRFFSDVKCPKCNYTGDARQFMLGCPNCGYGGPGQPAELDAGALKMETYDLEEVSGASLSSSAGLGRERQKHAGRPEWVGLLAIVMLMLTFGLLAIVYLITQP